MTTLFAITGSMADFVIGKIAMALAGTIIILAAAPLVGFLVW